jgi:long-chain acyl-CoA synthetase
MGEERDVRPDAEAIAEAATTGTTTSLHAAARPQRPALVSAHGNRTYAELEANANRLANALRAAGLQPGNAVALVCRNRPEFAEVYSACLRSGLRITPVNWHLTAEEMSYIIADCDALAVIADATFAVAVAEALADNPTPKVRLAIGGPIDGFADYAATIGEQQPTPPTTPSLGRTMLYTSGTTGRPKGVERYGTTRPASESPLYQRIIAAAAMTSDDTHLCTGPLYHAAPLAFSLGVPLLFGMTVVLMDGWDAEEMLRLVDGHKVTHTHVVPTMFHRLLALPEQTRAKYDVSSLRFVIHGAAPCPPEVKRGIIDWLGPVVYEYYAATEGGGTWVDSEEWLARPGTVGRPVEAGNIRIYDDNGDELGPNEVGTVYMRPANNGAFRYHKDEEKTAASHIGEFFTVGDHGYFDDEGYLFLTGRIAELIISGGVNIYPAEIDAVLLTHPAVADVGTIGVPDEEWGEQVMAVVELMPDIDATPELADELIAWCRERLAHYKCPRSVRFVEQLPRHDNGKLYRRRLRELFASVSS